MTDDAARDVLVAGAHALARGDGLEPRLQTLLESIAAAIGVASAAIFIVEPPDGLRIGASVGLEGQARAGLIAAVANPSHPIARTVAAPVPTFDVLPMAPGGPALRSHFPLIVTRGGADAVVGVLALAHDDPIDVEVRPIVQAGADLAAVAIAAVIAPARNIGS